MKKYIYVLTATVALISLSAKAQDGQDDGGNTKEKHKKAKEIIIREKPDAKGKTTVTIDENGNVTVNGKPATEWDGGKITVLPGGDGDDVIFLKRKLDDQMAERINDDMANQTRKFKVMMDRFYVDGKGARLGVYSTENEKGAEVTEVTDSSAAFKAGLKKGDIITKVGDSPISSPEALSKVIRDHQAGETLTIHYLRGDREEETRVTLQKQKEFQFRTLTMSPDMKMKIGPDFGPDQKFFFRNFPGRPRLGANIQDTEDSTGAKVLRVNPESPAATAGLQKDDVITSIDGKPVKSVDDALDALRDTEEKYNYTITVTRSGSPVTLQIKIPRDLKSATL
ncbi:PDZ domain-containing protein [Dinghuibacter silviterrae]|uniref:Serine protease Do n=1 Tax=Dinghuibacter silviterrae TaxID=1539049 RepID=A0A4R8DNT7_9BACT|nr:PDZ domain-containing protein [Dinghuibacter silviterrae]TDW99478.1 serine protease Do [Dinghuibacter silviterrae]